MSKTILVELSDALADAAELAGQSTVLVNARRRMPASGIVFAPDLVLTAEHVVEKDEDITVVLADGTEVPAKVAGRDAGSDLAVLKLERAAGTVAEVTKSPARLGQIALALARPSREGIEASLGTVSAIGGPLVNLLLCGMFLPAVLAGGRAAQAMNPLTLPVTPEQFAAASVTYQLPILALWLNWLLLAINLLPVYPLDGGQVLRSWLVSRFGATMAGEAAVRVAFVAGGVLALVALLVFKHVILMAIAFLILLLALQESFHLQSSESFDDSFMGYDFSQGYTSLERSDRKKPERQSGLLARWLEMRRAEKQRRLDRQREQVDQQLDGILAKVHECGLGALTPAERRLLKRASERFRSKDQDPT
jgi:Zn-dependent protease